MNLSPSLRNTPFGPMLKHWRLLNRVKQLHAAQMFGVCQSTISRWESGVQDAEPEQRARIEALLKARLSSAADHALARLVSGKLRSLCTWYATSPTACWPAPLPVKPNSTSQSASLLGVSLWPFATEEIATQEQRLADIGWRQNLTSPALEFATGENGSALVPIQHSLCRWTRLTLSDGSTARLVETLSHI